MAGLTLLILVWGYFHARSKVPYPADSGLDFPADRFVTADERFTEQKGIVLLDSRYFTKKAISMLENEIARNPVRELLTNTHDELRNSVVIVRQGKSASGNFQLLYEGRKNELEQNINSLKNQIENADYYSGYELRAQLSKSQSQLSRLDALKTFLSELNVKYDFSDLPYTDSPPNIQLICGHLENLSQNVVIKLRDAAPVIDKKFIAKAGIADDVIAGIDFREEKKIWKETVSAAKEKHEQATLPIRKEIYQRVNEQRGAIRNTFYTHWFGLLLMAFSTLCTYFALKRYYRIISRKGLPRKTSFEIYFATNMTSQILRWLALVIVVIGMIQLWGYLLLQVFQAETDIPILPLFNILAGLILPSLIGLVKLMAAGDLITTLLFCLLAPVALGFLTVLQSWFVLLLSEFICFVSNCYHILYNMAHANTGQTSKIEQ